MKLLILTQYYPPESGAPQNRLSDLAERLAGNGHEVQILTALPNYPADEVFPEYSKRKNSVEMMGGVRVARVGIYVPRRKTFVTRLLHYFSFVLNAIFHGPSLLKQPEIILMESPPLFIAFSGVYLARRFHAKLVVNISDLWPESALSLNFIKPGFFLSAGQWLEAWTYRHADLITGQTEGIVTNIRQRFPHKKVELYPNGVDLRRYDNSADRNKIRQEFGWANGRFVIGYAGVLGHAQKLDQILDAALLLRDAKDIHFALIGAGPCQEHLARRIQTENIQNAALYPAQKSSRMPEIYKAMDAGCVPLGREKIFEGARPSKMFEMMAAGLPLLVCARGEAVSITQSAPGGAAGLSAAPEEPAELAREARTLAGDRKAAQAMGERGSKLVAEQFDREQIAKKIEKLLVNLLNG